VDTIFSHAEVAALTGYVRLSRQKAWLAARGIPFSINARGEPILSRSAVESFLRGAHIEGLPRPRLEAIYGSAKKERQASAGASVPTLEHVLVR
jgi:hypothetical protein